MNAAPTGSNNPHNGTLFKGGSVFEDKLDVVTFTPVIEGESAAGVGTYTMQVGRTRKRGKTVHFDIAIAWTAHTGSGNLLVGGLPYTAKSLANYFVTCAIMSNNLTFSGQLCCGIDNAEDFIRVYVQASGTGVAALGIDGSASLWISGSYEVD